MSAFWFCSCRHPSTRVWYAEEMDALRAEIALFRSAASKAGDILDEAFNESNRVYNAAIDAAMEPK